MLVHLLVLSVLYLSWKKGRGKRSLSCPNPKKAAWSSPSASAAPHFTEDLLLDAAPWHSLCAVGGVTQSSASRKPTHGDSQPHTLQGQLRSILLLRPHLFGMSHARAQPAEPPLALRLHSTTGAPHRALSHRYTSFLSCSV